jgi:hypothetical protein
MIMKGVELSKLTIVYHMFTTLLESAEVRLFQRTDAY